jgi:hypothetical protein
MNLHEQLAEAQAALRDAEDTHRLVKTKAEQDAIIGANNDYGRNERDRERFLILALARDVNYARALLRLRHSELAVDQIKAALAMQEDDRRAWEWSIRAALVEALGTRREPFDAAMDCATMRRDFISALSELDPVTTKAERLYVGDVEVPDDWYGHD